MVKPPALPLQYAKAHQSLKALRLELASTLIGQENVIDQTLVGLLAGGHILLVGVPGLGKTMLMRAIAQVLDLTSKRIQCTPDLMPADILGAEILDQDETGKRHFRFIKGPIFAHIVMADEINRASPRCQSAFLEAMEERQVSISGQNHILPNPFHIIATQNPLEHEGTYLLPEAQLDRFIMQINMTYPTAEDERLILIQDQAPYQPKKMIPDAKTFLSLIADAASLPLSQRFIEAVSTILSQLRPQSSRLDHVRHAVIWGPGTRAGLALVRTAKARALLNGRLSPSIDDLRALALPVLRHRIGLDYAALASNHSSETIITSVIDCL